MNPTPPTWVNHPQLKLDMMKMAKSVKINVVIEKQKQWAIRVRLAVWLIWLASLVGGFGGVNVKMNDEIIYE